METNFDISIFAQGDMQYVHDYLVNRMQLLAFKKEREQAFIETRHIFEELFNATVLDWEKVYDTVNGEETYFGVDLKIRYYLEVTR